MNIIEEKWRQLTAFSSNTEQKEKFLQEILTAYASPERTYHNLSHITFMLQLCEENLNALHSPASVGFAILYHDIIYNTERRDNEEESAEKARKQLRALQLKRSIIDEVEAFILATKDHNIPEEVANKNDLAYFLDFDLAVLGLPDEAYKAYSKNIRQEYLQYRTHVYRKGRKQAMSQLLQKEHIFFTEAMRQRFEQQARENINNELAELV